MMSEIAQCDRAILVVFTPRMPRSINSPSSPDLDPRKSIKDLRQESVALETRILELQDRILAKDTDRADAVALLGQTELVLEGKIAYIVELDRALNARIEELERECDRKTREIDLRGEAIQEAQRECSDRDATIAGLNQRLEEANQEISRTHELARTLAVERDTGLTKNAELTAQLESGNRIRLGLASDIAALQERWQKTDHDLAQETEQLRQSQAEASSLQTRVEKAESSLARIVNSALWKWGRLWRAFFGPEL